jgi:hypothetical protein
MSLDHLKTTLAAMTPGPWFSDGYTVMSAYIPKERRAYLTVEVCEAKRSMPDAEGIVALRNAAPALIECAELLRYLNSSFDLNEKTHAMIDAALARLEGNKK